jgi:hypothetical protein
LTSRAGPDWNLDRRLGGPFGAFVAALLAIPFAGALQVVAGELWQVCGAAGPTQDATGKPIRVGFRREMLPADQMPVAGIRR